MKKKDLSIKKLPLPKSIKENLESIDLHEKFYKHQNKEYISDINNLDNNSCVIVIDYKENFKIGGGPIETNNCFYEKIPISLLGFAIAFKENEKIKYEYHDFLSEILSHDSLFSGQCLISLLKNNKFKNIKNIKVWTDNGNHFRSYEFLYYLFKEVPKIIKGTIKFNRFVECHGKSIVDGHFGVLSKIFKQKENEMYIKNINDLKMVFEREEERKGLYETLVNNSDVSQKTFFYIYDRKSRPKKSWLEVKAFYVNLSYLMKDGELYVSPLTFEDVKEYSKINYCAKFCTDDRETKRADTTKGLVGHVHEVGRITKTYISHRVNSLLNTTTFFSKNN